ncbi:hypothetical protein LWI28_014435 [Acer negundo]|uniref:Uncharacterized protein n=1 Tax=Acer negundo TaxID=4023 RepID=A0AAD5IE02_ACENE|nr:hypothetical protein LWI28_014435 [Acer negundo]
MSDIDRRGTLHGISMPFPAPPSSPLCYYGGGSSAVINNFPGIAVNAQGCISLGDLINNVRDPFRKQLLNLVFDHLTFLSKDPIWELCCARVIGLQNPDLTDKICSELQGKYVELSMLKCGSHVVENA